MHHEHLISYSHVESIEIVKLHLFVYCFSMPKEFQLYSVFRSDNFEKSDRKSILRKDGVNSNEKEGTTNEISLSLDLINVIAITSMSVFRNLDCL